ncbi:MAG: DUF1343 domain-containing protein [Bacteroidales bacterium]
MKNKIAFLYGYVFAVCVLFSGCGNTTGDQLVEPGAYQTGQYIDLLTGKKVGIVANHTSMIRDEHLIDTLLKRGVNVVKIFSPEHGFKGTAEAGALVQDDRHGQSFIPVVSLYGLKKKPDTSDMKDLDLVVFDLQDVGVRFYTYLSTLHYIMEACAENDIPLIVLDRPNPNGFYIDGPVLEAEFRSFVGMHPVPVVYGMTIGEYAGMINGEGWLRDSVRCELTVIQCSGYHHSSYYILPVNPSPNLRSQKAIYLYPSVAFFEGTIVSEGRGTDYPFLVAGHPDYPDKDFSFIPHKKNKDDPEPKLSGKTCYGMDLRGLDIDSIRLTQAIDISYLTDMYIALGRRNDFFTGYFDLLAGNDQFRMQLIRGADTREIRSSWQFEIEKFKKIRQKYLLYP